MYTSKSVEQSVSQAAHVFPGLEQRSIDLRFAIVAAMRDAVIMAIVDSWDIDGAVKWRKHER